MRFKIGSRHGCGYSTGAFPLPAVEERVDHAADDRARADDRDLHDEVVELPRRVARQRGHLRPALDLEDAHRVRLVHHPVDLGIVRGQVREIDLDLFVRPDHRDRLFERREHAEAQEIHLDDAEVGAVVLVPLHDDAPGHRRRLERHDFVEPAGGHDHPARVLAEVTRQVLDLKEQPQKMPRPRVLRIEPRRGDLGRELRQRTPDLAEVPGRELFGKPVDLLGRVAEGLADLARGGAVAVCDDVGRHGGAVRPVLLVDVLDDALALVARGKVEVDVGPLAALLGEEPLEEQLHLHRIDGRDRERVADGAVGGGPAPLHEDLLPQAELDDVPDDQEVAREVELLDHRELLLDLRLRARRQRPEARARAVPRDLPEKRLRRLPGRKRVLRKPVPEVGQGEVEPARELPRVVERLRQVREGRRHLLRAAEVAAALRGEQAPRGVEVRVVADAREDVVELLVPLPRVPDAVRRDERKPEAAREIDDGAVAVLLLAQPVPLQLHVEASGKDRAPFLELLRGRVDSSRRERAGEGPLVASRQNVEPRRVLRDLLAGDEPLPLLAAERAGGDEAAEVAVAGLVLDEEGEPCRLNLDRPCSGRLLLLWWRSRSGRGASRTTSAPTSARMPAARAAL